MGIGLGRWKRGSWGVRLNYACQDSLSNIFLNINAKVVLSKYLRFPQKMQFPIATKKIVLELYKQT